jgi:hypothetical protein
MPDEQDSQQVVGRPAPVAALRCGGARDDPRLQQGAYITDGIELYEVTGLRRGPGVAGVATARVIVEDCRSYRALEFLPDRICGNFTLVRDAPVDYRPERAESIVR